MIMNMAAMRVQYTPISKDERRDLKDEIEGSYTGLKPETHIGEYVTIEPLIVFV